TGMHRWAIGVDVDEYVFVEPDLRPHVLTSMLKRVDMAIERLIEERAEGPLDAGPVVF
ncbi:MAG: BMP family ABC transporter substrate-binding protein, partial [Actinobacteria bacterium]|nr:BMP family ABC transporter substrate-binding protein [Actinomycetota bacterium]